MRPSSTLPKLFPAALFCAALLSASPSLADSGTVKRGRSADGRAYRIDSEGLKMSDYIAELEVTVDDLKRQLIAAEDELAAKNARGGAPAAATKIQETTIAGSNAPRQNAALPPAAQVPSECEKDAMGLRNEIQRLQTELASRSTVKAVQPVAMKCDYNSPDNPLWEQVNRLQNALMTGPTKENVAEGEKRRAELEAEVRALQSELSAKNESVKESQSMIAQLQEKIEDAETRVARATAEAAAPARAALATPPAPVHAVAEADPSAVRGAGESYRTQLARIQSLISERKNLLDASKSKKGVSVSIQPLVSRSGASLDSLRGEVSRLSTASDLSAISAGLSDIERILQEDVGVLKRLSSLR